MPEREPSKFAIIIPTKDWVELSAFQQRMLSEIFHEIDQRRITEGSAPLSKNRYIVCNQDEPYAQKVWEAILEGEKEKKEHES